MSDSNQSTILAKIRSKSSYDWVVLLGSLWPRLKSRFYYPLIFGSFGKGSILYKPLFLQNPRHIHIGERVHIRQGVRLQAVVLDALHPPEIRIGNHVNIEQYVQIVALGRIHVHDGAAIGGTSALQCGAHPFLDVDASTPIVSRLAGQDAWIEVGENSLIGMGVFVEMNTTIGKHVVIGPNSVVKHSIPDYSVASGNPAKVTLRYDAQARTWQEAPVA